MFGDEKTTNASDFLSSNLKCFFTNNWFTIMYNQLPIKHCSSSINCNFALNFIKKNMNKYFLTLLVVLSMSVVLKAQNKLESTGNAGIGTTTPDAMLKIVKGGTQYDFFGAVNNWGANLNVNTTTGGWARLNSFSLNNQVKSSIGAKGTGTTFEYLYFDTNATDYLTAFASPELVIRNNGNVGIGTTTPSGILHLYNKNTLNYEYNTIFDTNSITFETPTNQPSYINKKDGGNLAFRMGSDYNTAMLINSNGSVGIGTTTPEGNMQIGSGTQNGMLFLGGGKGYSGIGATRSDGGLALGYNIYTRYNDNSDNLVARVGSSHGYKGISGIKFSHAGVIDFFGTNQAVTADEVANSPERSKMRILGNGNVGIGTINPLAKLHITDQATSTVTSLQINDKVKFRGDGVINWGASADYGILSWDASKAIVGAQTNKDLSLLSGGTEKMIIKADGNIGIGTTSPANKFDVNGDIRFSTKLVIATDKGTLWKNAAGNVELQAGSASSGLELKTTTNNPILFTTNGGSERMRVLSNGNVGIGTTDPGTYKLAVNGNIHTKEVKVDMIAWSDFVFEKNYSLPTLKEVAQHIEEKGHLKDIPSAKEVAKNGIFLGEMDAKLLQKIEELTLYTLEQEEKINLANTKITQLETEKEAIKNLSKLVLELQTKIESLKK